MSKNLILFIGVWMATLNLWAGQPLKKALTFVSSDSIVVWGDDRSDYRTTALGVAAELKARPICVEQEVDNKQLKRVQKQWEQEVLPSLHLSGGVADEQGDISVVPTSALIMEAGKLFLQTADAQYIDAIERTALNALMAVAVPGELSFEKHIAAQALMNTSGMVYATDDEGLFVNLFINSSTHIKTGKFDFVIDQLTAMPHEGRVKLRISGLKKGLAPIQLRVRMPNWCCGAFPESYHFGLEGTPDKYPLVYVNGREEQYPVVNGYLVINRQWNSGDEVFFDFPFKVQYLHPKVSRRFNTEVVALQRGPLIYGFLQPTEHFSYDKKKTVTENVAPNNFGHTTLSVPVTLSDGKEQVKMAEPLMDGGKYMWMNASK